MTLPAIMCGQCNKEVINKINFAGIASPIACRTRLTRRFRPGNNLSAEEDKSRKPSLDHLFVNHLAMKH